MIMKVIVMINEELLLKNGFKKFEVPVFYNCDSFYQKKIDDKRFLEALYYDTFKDNGAIDYKYEFQIIEERETCWCIKKIYALDKNMTLEDVQEELNK